MDFMNEPVYTEWSDADIVRDFKAGYTKKELSRIYLLPVREITKIIANEGDINECRTVDG